MLLPALSLVSVLFFASPALADGAPSPACSGRFFSLLSRASSNLSGMGQAEAEASLAALQKKTVQEIFPETQLVRTGRRTTETRVKSNPAAMKRFKDHFDDLWESRVAAGKMPAWELKEYRAWLKTQANSEGAYPPVNAKELFDDYVSDGGTITEYFDFKFIEYLEKVKFTRPGAENVHEAVEEYLKTLDHSVLRNALRVMKRKAKSYAQPFFNTTIGLTAGVVVALPFTILNEGLGNAIIGQAFTTFFTTSARNITVQTAEQVRDWGALFAGGEEKYVTTLYTLARLSYNLEQEKFDEMPRVEAAKKLESFMKETATLLPQFHNLVLSEQKDFETKWDKRLQDTRESIVAAAAAHQQHRIAMDQLRAIVASREGGMANPEELERLAEYTHEMEISADYIANVLADWLFYKQARGKDKPLDPALERNFATVYERYLRTMSPGRLAKAINARVKAHVSQLEKYSKKVKGYTPDPAVPEVKPEDQIKVETPIDSGAAEPQAPAPVPVTPSPTPPKK